MRQETDRGGESVAPDDAERRAAQDTAAELNRMGIDPRTVGLDPLSVVHSQPVGRVRGTASVPAGTQAQLVEHFQAPAPETQPLAFGTLPDEPTRPWAAADTRPGLPPRPPVRGWFEPPLDRGRSPGAPFDVPTLAPPGPTDSFLSRPLGDRTSPRPQDTRQVAGSLERVADSYGAALPAAWRRTMRAATFGLLNPGAAEAIEQERRLVARVRTRHREPWIVAFMAGKGGVGTTTTAAGVALVLATLRTDGAALVDAQRGTASLGVRLAGRPAPTVTTLSQQAQEPPLRVRGALAVVDGGPWHGQVARDELVQVVERLRQSNAFTLVDAGDDMSETGHAMLGRADRIVLVTTTSQDALAGVRIALGRVQQVEPHRLSTIVVAVVCLTSRQYRRTAQRLREQLGLPGRRIVAVPFDPVLAAGGLLEPSHLRVTTREAFLRLAAHIADPGPPDEAESPRSTVGAEAGWKTEVVDEYTGDFPVVRR